MELVQILAQELDLNAKRVEAAVELIDAGNTIPFIARYRKEATGAMDDQVLRQLADRLEYLRNLDKRRQEIYQSIAQQEAMTNELEQALLAAKTLAELEDLYRPLRPKRKTRASMARQLGLAPLAEQIWKQNPTDDSETLALPFCNEEVKDTAAALSGARDILAEQMSDDPALRTQLRRFYQRFALLVSKAAKEEDGVYAQYYDFAEPVSKAAGHRVLALDRGEREGFLKVSVQVDTEKVLGGIRQMYLTGSGSCSQQVALAIQDSFTRLIAPSMEREVRSTLTEQAAEGAIHLFGENLRQLLLQPPIKGKVTLGMDPGYRMGCKLAVVDPTGKVLDTAVVYPVPEFKKVEQAKQKVKQLISTHGVQVIAIGNGTASKETELFAAGVIQEMNNGVQYMMVNEAGASVYSASKLAAEEFPQYDVNLRSAVSIARRLQDPLAELVKIEPKAVGVGQYQHDMPQKRLNETLDGVVEACVNQVGVDLNTASVPLLTRVSGLTASTAKQVVAWREENGPFQSRSQLKKVKGLGPKAFEQCAGFLRLPGAKEPLDATAVHPESYPAARALLELCGFSPKDIGTSAMEQLPKIVQQIGADKVCQQAGIGQLTLQDVVQELIRPGRDMRDELPPPILRSDVMSMEDLKPGMELQGTVRNVIDFGAFVDIGVHQDGLVHISQLSESYLKHPSQAVKVGDVVKVWVLDVDLKKKRISLTMKASAFAEKTGKPQGR